MNAQIAFLGGTYTLVHIPLDLYSSLLQPILRVLLHQTRGLSPSATLDPPDFGVDGLTQDGQHGFLNISITPIEVSIVCHSSWAKNVFEPAIAALPKDAARAVQVSRHQYTILSVISAGLDAASRVMDLTSPLALAGIPIFFISTYYSDFILVPERERGKVISALMEKGFELTEGQSAFVNPSAYGGNGGPNDRRSSNSTTPPRTPPPSSVAELQVRAFDLLKKRSITPQVFSDLELVQCSGREISPMTDVVYNHRRNGSRHGGSDEDASDWVDSVDAKLYTCIVSALVSQPKFMSLTLAQEDPPSLLIDKTLLPIFGDSLIGDTEGRQIPIFLDLASLPTEVTGIVCGVAGRLVQEMRMATSSELSYLSTARAGAVILPEEQSAKALEILQPLLSKMG